VSAPEPVGMLTEEEVARSLQLLKVLQTDMEKQYKRALEHIRSEIKRVQSRCPHPRHVYYPDASGNNDSYSLCAVCGLEV